MTKVNLDKLSAAQLVLIHNAVTTGAQVKKFESQPKALARTLYVLGANALTLEQGARLAGLLPAEDAAPAEKVLVRTQEWPYAKAVGPEPKAYDPASIRQATNLVNGETVSVANVHGPVRAVDGDPEAAARKVAAEAVAPLKAARKAATPQVAALPGVTPLGLKEVARPHVEAARKFLTALDGKDAAEVALTREQSQLLGALVDCKALSATPLDARAGVWVKYKAIHESDTPHNLAKGQLPGLTGALRRRGFIELRGSSANGEVQVTAAGLAFYLRRS
jgi:hypothetical protein